MKHKESNRKSNSYIPTNIRSFRKGMERKYFSNKLRQNEIIEKKTILNHNSMEKNVFE